MPDDTVKPVWWKRKKVQIPAAALVVLMLFSVAVMVVNYSFPGFFTLSPLAAVGAAEAVEDDIEEAATQAAPPPVSWPKGLMTANTLIVISENLSGNWLPNDKIWPTVFLDNPQHFQLGALEMLKYTTRVLRDNMSRRTTDQKDMDCEQAFTLLSNDPLKWIMPSAESRYKMAAGHLRSYRDRLAASGGNDRLFFPQTDNLRVLLEQYVSLLGDVNTRLANAPGGRRYKISEEIAAGAASGPDDPLVEVNVPWKRIDDNFYYAQGVAYVLRQMMVAIKYDFSEILASKQSTPLVDSIIAVLNQAQFEPLMVLNGDIGSLMANHSMELHSLLENSRQKIRNLHDALGQ
jgi:hypothetical protein